MMLCCCCVNFGAGDMIQPFGSGAKDVWLIRIGGEVTGAMDKRELPRQPDLHQNYPNPFNPRATLGYDLPERSEVVLTIYDILGRRVRTLVRGVEEPGYKSVIWDGTNDLGEEVSAGVYLYRISAGSFGQAGNFTQTRKMILLR